MRRLSFIFLLILWSESPLCGQEQVSIKTEVQPTSVLPGDEFDFIVRLEVSEGVRVMVEDFGQARVNLDPFIIRDLEVKDVAGLSTTVYTFTYRLANFEFGDRLLEIPSIRFRHSDPADLANPNPAVVESLTPPHPIRLLSTLNRPLEESRVQEQFPLSQQPSSSWIALFVGALGVFSGLLFFLTRLRKDTKRGSRRIRRTSQRHFYRTQKQALQELQAASRNRPAQRNYEALEKLLDQHSWHFWEFQASALTEEELEEKLPALNVASNQGTAIVDIFSHGRTCRYEKPDDKDWEAQFSQDLALFKRLFLTS